MSNERIRVLIVEDHSVVRAGLKRLLEDQPDIQVVGDVERGEDAIGIVDDQAPNVVLLDLVLDNSRMDGLDVLKQITASSPLTRVVVLSAYSDESLVFPALRHGAVGYVLKRAVPDEVIDAVRAAARGYYHIDPSLLKKVFEHMPDSDDWRNLPEGALTPREQELLPLLAKGMTNTQIADQMNISQATVKTHVSNILRKLGVPDRSKISIKRADQGKPVPS